MGLQDCRSVAILDMEFCGVGAAKGVLYLPSGHIVNPSMGIWMKRPVSYSPEGRYSTPLATHTSPERRM